MVVSSCLWTPPGETAYPEVLSTPSGSHAMGVFIADCAADGNPPIGCDCFEFQRERLVHWNCVFRLASDIPLRSSERWFQVYGAQGSREGLSSLPGGASLTLFWALVAVAASRLRRPIGVRRSTRFGVLRAWVDVGLRGEQHSNASLRHPTHRTSSVAGVGGRHGGPHAARRSVLV